MKKTKSALASFYIIFTELGFYRVIVLILTHSIFNKINIFQFSNITIVFRGPPDRAVEIYLLLKGPSLVLLELGLKVAAPHFQAELSPGPDIPHCSPHLLLVQGVTEVSHHRLELLQSAGLDSSDLCLAIAPEVVVTWSLVGAARRPRDLRVTGDHASPELLPDPLE